MAAGDKPSEPTAAKVWNLARIHYPMHEVEAAIRMMANASFSSKQVEQGHTFSSNSMQRHKEYGEESLRTRSFCGIGPPLGDSVGHPEEGGSCDAWPAAGNERGELSARMCPGSS